ncbi:MAG: hypothetical protein KGD73_07930 [Candidatus Lokiarchaeota archaeon]|nr:hypothetical protein [Candidatus Lokiarchaeota archaeon]
MCNECQCSNDMYDRCSIVGCMPIHFCCEQCAGHELRHSCECYQLDCSKLDTKKQIHVTTNMENTTQKKSEEVTLIINKR